MSGSREVLNGRDHRTIHAFCLFLKITFQNVSFSFEPLVGSSVPEVDGADLCELFSAAIVLVHAVTCTYTF